MLYIKVYTNRNIYIISLPKKSMVNSKMPVIVPDRLLISPGIWNDNEYSQEEISDAFSRTNWGDKNKISLWLNHDDRNASAFVGYVRNPRLESEGRVFGDLELWDEQTARILTEAMAKFGISAKIAGKENAKTGKMSDFSFENFSVVTTPACADAYINLSKKEDDAVSKYLVFNEKIDGGVSTEESDLKKDVRRLKEMENEEENKESVVENAEVVEEVKDNSEKNLLQELNNKFDKLIELLSKKELSEDEPEEDTEETVEDATEAEEEAAVEAPVQVVEENKELAEVKKELAEVKAKLNAPKSKTIKNLSSNTVGNDMKYNSDIFCDFLESVNSPMKII